MSRPLALLLLGAILLASCTESSQPSQSAEQLAPYDGPPRMFFPGWDGGEQTQARWSQERPGGSAALHVAIESRDLIVPIRPRGPLESYAIVILASGDPERRPAPPSRLSRVGLRADQLYELKIGAREPIWKTLRAGEPLYLRIGLFAGELYDQLDELWGEMPGEELQRRWRGLAAKRLDTRLVVAHFDQKPPVVTALIPSAEPLDLRARAARPALFALRVREELPWMVEIQGRAVARASWSRASRDLEGRGGERVIAVAWPCSEGASGKLDANLEWRVVDRAGNETRGAAHYAHDEDSPPPPPAIPPVSPSAASSPARVLLPGWDGNAGLASRWIWHGYDDGWKAREIHRLVSPQPTALVAFEVAGDQGPMRLEVLAGEHRSPLPWVDVITRRFFDLRPGERVLVAFDLPRSKTSAMYAAPLYVHVNLWRRAKLVGAGVPKELEQRSALRSELLDQRFLELYADLEAPRFQPAIPPGTALSFPHEGRALFEFLLGERFPLEVRVGTTPIPRLGIDLQPIDSGFSGVLLKHGPLVGQRPRPLATAWPLDAQGEPATRIELSCRDRSGRRSRETITYRLDPAVAPLLAAAPCANPSAGSPPAKARLHLLGSGDTWEASRWAWRVQRQSRDGVLLSLRRRVCPFPAASLRFLVEGPPGDYRVELWINPGSGQKKPTEVDDSVADAIFDLAPGQVGQVGIDLRGLDKEKVGQRPCYVQLALFRRDALTTIERPRDSKKLALFYAGALDIVRLHLYADSRDPRIVALIPEGSNINPDGAAQRPWPALCFALDERFPEILRVQGVEIPLEEPRSIDRNDVKGDRLTQDERFMALPWPDAEAPEGAHEILVECRDRRGVWARRKLTYLFDRSAPRIEALQPAEGEVVASSEQLCSVRADEPLGEVLWIEPAAEEGGCERVTRFLVQGSSARASLHFEPGQERRGTLVVADRAGNEVRRPWSLKAR